MAQTIEDVNDRTLLQQFHSLYKKQDAIETNVENVDAKVEQEKSDRKAADAGLQKLIYQQATFLGNEVSGLRNDVNTNTNKIEYQTTQISALQTGKQDKLTAGTNITIDENNIISASGGGEQVYEHHISITHTYAALTFTIRNNDSTNYGQRGFEKIKTALINQGFTTSKNRLMASGVLGSSYQSTEIGIIIGVYSESGFVMIVSKTIRPTNIDVANNKITFDISSTSSTTTNSLAQSTVIDNVIAI